MKRTPDATPFEHLLSQRLTRRRVLATGATLAPLAVAGGSLLGACTTARAASALSFKPIQGSKADDVLLPPGYRHDMIVRWGDSLWSSVADLDAARLADGALLEPGAAERQQRQFGTNCDAIHFFPLDARGERGILCVNNEFTLDEMMFPQHPGMVGALRGDGRDYVIKHPQAVDVAKAALGVSVIEVARVRGRWQMVKDSRFNRRITAETPIDIGGPARGAALLRTQADPDGVRALGTFGNCAGGETPWGTYLTAEENIQDYFGNLDQLKARSDVDPHIVESHRRWRMWKVHSLYAWEAVDARFDLPRTPTEPFRFGWIVEIDPRDPTRAPVKRTALGRCAHEGASPVIAHDGRVAVYMGDDDKFEYIYKFVSDGALRSEEPGGEPRPARSRHAVRRAAGCERPRRMAAARVRSEGSAECGRRVSRPGRGAHQGARRRHRAGRDADGSNRGHRSESRERTYLRRLHAQRTAHGRRRSHRVRRSRSRGRCRSRQSARRESVRPHRRNSRGRRRSHRARVLVGGLPARRRSRRRTARDRPDAGPAGQRVLRRLREGRRAEPDRLAGQRRLRPRWQPVDRHRRAAAARRRTTAAGCVRPTARSAAACNSS